MTAPRVSILLPVRNAADTLKAAIDSALAQTFTDFELVIADDSSTDASAEIAASVANGDPRVLTVGIPPPGGLIPALNLAARTARGPYLARMDADDLMSPTRIERQVDFLDAHPDVGVCSCLIELQGNNVEGFHRYIGWLNGLLDHEAIARERFIESPVVHPSVMMRRESFELVGGYRDSGWAEDYDLWLRFIERGIRFAKVPEFLFTWVDHEERLTRNDPRYSRNNFLRAKACFLARMPSIRDRGVMISGAGPIGKSISRLLRAEGINVHAILDVSSRRIGGTSTGIPILRHTAFPKATPSSPIQIAAVGQAHRRDPIRRMMSDAGYSEGVDFFCIA